jgi:hypothetical protein
VEETARFRLPLLVAGQGQKEITHNEALVLLDAAIGSVAERRDLSVPPETAVEGQCWLVPASAVQAWEGRVDQLAIWTSGGWRFLTVPEGTPVYIRSEQACVRRVNGVWAVDVPIGPPAPRVAAPTGGMVMDLEARVAVVQILELLRTKGLVQQ